MTCAATRMKTSSAIRSTQQGICGRRFAPHTPLRACGRARPLLAVLLLLGAGCFVRPAEAKSHNKKPTVAVERVAHGQVVNDDNQPISNAIVYLENPKSLAVKSYLTDNSGHFHFKELTPETDYDLWAEKNGQQSKHKWISQFSDHTSFDFKLELDPSDKHKFLGIF